MSLSSFSLMSWDWLSKWYLRASILKYLTIMLLNYTIQFIYHRKCNWNIVLQQCSIVMTNRKYNDAQTTIPFQIVVWAEIKRKSTDFFRFVKEKQQIQKNRRLMDFTKEQVSVELGLPAAHQHSWSKLHSAFGYRGSFRGIMQARGERKGLKDLMEIMIWL